MKKLILFAAIFLFHFSKQDTSTPQISPGEYPENNLLSVFSNLIDVRWKIHTSNNTIEFGINGSVTGWIGIGFHVSQESTRMNNLDVVQGYYNTGQKTLNVVDKYANGLSSPKTDVSLGGKNDILSFNGGVFDGNFIFKFNRLLDTGDAKYDRIFKKGDELDILVAYSASENPTDGHSNRGRFQNIDLFTGTTIGGNTGGSLFPFQYIVLVIMFLITCIIGFILKYVHAIAPFDIFLHSMIFKNMHGWKYIIEIVNFYTSRKISDVFLFISYSIVVASFVVVKTFDSVVSQNSVLSTIGRVLGHLNLLNFALVFLPVSRNSVFTLIFGISFERAIAYHRTMGFMTFYGMVGHGLFMFLDYTIAGSFTYLFSTTSNSFGFPLAGPIAFLLFSIMLIFALDIFRRNTWELFHYSHWILGVPACIILCFHHWYFPLYIALGIGLFFLDLIIRIIIFLFPATLTEAQAFPNEVTKLTIHKPNFKWEGGQYVFLWVPKISPFEHHPFSIACGPNGVIKDGKKNFTLYIKAMNGKIPTFTKKLYDLVSSGNVGRIGVEGSYGKPSVDYKQYEILCLVSGGIGITPMLSILEEIHDNIDNMKKLTKIYFYWVVKREEDVKMVQAILEKISKNSAFEIIINLTQDKGNINPLKSITINQGRINFSEMVSEMKTKHPNVKRFAVYSCGPQRMNVDLYNICRKESLFRPQKFHLHQETFHF